jgi:hypothetical protein
MGHAISVVEANPLLKIYRSCNTHIRNIINTHIKHRSLFPLVKNASMSGNEGKGIGGLHPLEANCPHP